VRPYNFSGFEDYFLFFIEGDVESAFEWDGFLGFEFFHIGFMFFVYKGFDVLEEFLYIDVGVNVLEVFGELSHF
jgi:hypothetical protein